METICLRVKIKPDSIEGVKEWFKTLSSRVEEVKDTMKKENVFVESVFLDRGNEATSIIYYMKAKNINEAVEIFQKSNASVDLYHQKQWATYCLEAVTLETLFDAERIESN